MKRSKSFILLVVIATVVCSITAVTAIQVVKKGSIDWNRLYERSGFVQKANRIESKKVIAAHIEKPCIFKTVFGEQASDSGFVFKTSEKVQESINRALTWISRAQNQDGGWAAGQRFNESYEDNNKNATSAKSDPATTSMVGMALLRCGSSPIKGQYSAQSQKALDFLLNAVEKSSENADNITTIEGTQPQVKLGGNIDVILTSQYLTNLSDEITNAGLKNRINLAINKCIRKIQNATQSDGSIKNGGWASVLQSSLADNALETAYKNGAKVDTVIMNKSKNFHKGNVNATNENVATEKAAGVVLYAVSSTSRSSAKEAKLAKEAIEDALKSGKTKSKAITTENLKKSGMSDAQAMKYASAYSINQTSQAIAQRDEVITGFGNNGGEEFLSYVQTIEAMVMSKNLGWKKWYDNIGGRLLNIQEKNGSWTGHHCITSPVFCTATCLLFLSVNNDVEELINL